jgi:hypothetical protein
MRERIALFAMASTIVLALTLSPSTWAQQQTGRTADEQAQNPTVGQDRNQKSSEMETIRGVVAAVAVEGEMMLDYRSNRAAAAEATFLTVVGSPIKSDGQTRDRAAAPESDRRGRAAGNRHNVYIVMLTPRTKVCEASRDSEKSSQTPGQSEAQKKEVALDQLEVGDHVEIQFARREDSGANNFAHQTEQMRQKHGRHRTYVGYATSVTILPSKDHDQSSSAGEAKPTERPQ